MKRRQTISKMLPLLAILICCVVLTAAAQTADKPALRKKVGVVLSGGGAKGMAHIGALKVIERAGIPIDYIVGTSMGSIVGGLYAIGYDAAMLDSVVRQQNWKFLLSDQVNPRNLSMSEKDNQDTYLLSRPVIRRNDTEVKGGLVSGHNLANLFSRLTVGYHDSINFNNLPIPFACVATNIVDYSEVDIHSGWLSQAMRASMAIPGFFTPVRVDSMVLVDGGLKNNYPVDVARRMGADVVIGVSVQAPPKTAGRLKSGADILLQVVDFSVKNKYDDNVEHTDVPILVDVNGYSSMSFTSRAIDSLIDRGEAAAMAQWDRLVRLRDSLGIDSASMPRHVHRSADGYLPRKVRLLAIDYDGVSQADSRYISRKYHIHEGDSVSSVQLEQAMQALRTDLMYSSADYALRQMPGGYWLRVSAGQRKALQANLGVRFDSEEMVALQAGSEFRFSDRIPLGLSVTGRLGKRYMAHVEATVMPTSMRNWTVGYTYRHNDINIYRGASRDYNVTYDHHEASLSLIKVNGKNYGLDLTARWEYFHFGDVLAGWQSAGNHLADEHFYSYRLHTYYHSENSRYFTTRGARLDAEYAVLTDNLIRYHGSAPLQLLRGDWRIAVRLNSHLTLQPSVYGRVIWGGGIPWCLGNFIGGDYAAHYLDQQLPFAGVGNLQTAGNAFVACGLKLQQRVMDNNYFILRATLAQTADKVRHLGRQSLAYGYQLGWAYDSFFGPVSAHVGYSNLTRKAYFYLNLGYMF